MSSLSSCVHVFRGAQNGFILFLEFPISTFVKELHIGEAKVSLITIHFMLSVCKNCKILGSNYATTFLATGGHAHNNIFTLTCPV